MKINAISFRLIGLMFSIFCAVSCSAAEPPATTKVNYNVTMNDGTVLVGTIQIKKVAFTASYGAIDVNLGDIVSFSGGFLTLNDGSKLKGSFSSGNLTLETARGEMNLPFASISSIIKSSQLPTAIAATPAPASPTISSTGNGASLTGKVFDCFGKPLAGVSVSVQNTRFSATTDAQGNYSLGYVPGAIQVSYSKDGYYATSLTFQIATPSLYPVQDLILFKELPAKGIFFIGENDYVKSVNSIQLKNLESKQFSWAAANTENQHFITGAPLLIKPANDFRFVFNNNSSDSPVTTVLFRVQPGSPFVRRVQYGVGNIKFLGDQIKSGTVLQVGNFELWTGHLDVGFYVFVTQYNPELDNFTSFGEPCLYFRVGDESNAASDSAIANPSGNLPTTENKTLTATPQTPFEKLTATVPNANLFDNHTKEYAFSYDQVWGAVSSLIATQKEKVLQSDKNTGTLTTDVTRHGIFGFPSYDQYCLLVEKVNDTSTKVTLKVLRYYMDFAGQHGPPNTLQPQAKQFANNKAEEFLDKVNKQLQTGK